MTGEKLRRAESKIDVALQLTEDLDLERALENLLAITMSETRAARGVAIAVDHEGSILQLVHEGFPAEQAPATGKPRVSGLAGEILQEPQPLRLENLPDGGPDDLWPFDGGIGSCLGASLRRRSKEVGVICLGREDGDPPFNGEDENFIRTLMPLASTAVANAISFREVSGSARRLRTLDDRRSDFISMVSHELRSPMTVISGIADLLEKRADRLSPEQRSELISTLGRESRRLTRLVSGILDLEAVDRGGLELEFDQVDLSELASETAADARLPGRLAVVVEEGDPVVRGDRDKIKQVVINLVSNAAKFSEDSAPIVITVSPNADEVGVAVSDQGPGIAPEQMDRLFRRFSRLGTDSRKRSGSGLGLYLSRSIVESHGGRIWAESTPGEGSTFTFTLPRHPTPSA